MGERYVLQRLLGTGTFSTVCAAQDSITQEMVRACTTAALQARLHHCLESAAASPAAP